MIKPDTETDFIHSPAQLARLAAAAEFFEALGLPFDAKVVKVNRLHILQRYHDYLGRELIQDMDDAALRDTHAKCLQRAYEDFLTSAPLAEKVFKVFKDQAQPERAFVGIDSIAPLPTRS